jgi:preprotein translocase subunit SecA
MSLLSKIFSNEETRMVHKVSKEIEAVFSFEDELKTITPEGLKERSALLRNKVVAAIEGKNGEERKDAEAKVLDEVLPEAFALVREASRRTLKMMHYKVQVIGGALLHRGNISEMRTGEGKTLVATLPAYLNALTGRGVHVVTVNDYLSRRDAVWMGQVYDALGMTTSVINHQSSYMYDKGQEGDNVETDDLLEKESFKVAYEHLRSISRKEAYAADITYGTNNEFGFDYLRDNIGYNEEALVQRGFHYAIVDEIDSILIDESRTPLIISAPAKESGEDYRRFARVAEDLTEGEHYTVDEKQRAISLSEAGIERAEALLGVTNIYTTEGMRLVHHLETAVKAKALFLKEKEYVVKDGEVIIVDEFTGRMQPGRRWSDGLHQAIEAKEGTQIKEESRTLASITFQNYFRFYEKLSGMTGTAETSKEEFYKVYTLPVVPVPTHNPISRTDHPDLIFQNEKGKWKALAKKVKELHALGQPVLIGTISIEKNEVLSRYLEREGVPHAVLNAKNHEREGEIIAEAGKKGAVTIATNMAGRGVDIKLGGPLATEAEKEAVIALGGLFVIGTERHEARRIDNQLRGRAGRQGDPGQTQFFVSLEDSLMRVFGGDGVKNMMGKIGLPEDEPIESKFVSKALESAQEKIEGFHFDSRKYTLQYDDVLNVQRKSVYERRRKILFNDEVYIEGLLADLEKTKEGIAALLAEKYEKFGVEAVKHTFRTMLLQIIDSFWMDHLDAMEHLRQSVNLRAYGQRDPLVEYKKEALRMYKSLDGQIKNDAIMFIENMEGVFAMNQAVESAQAKPVTLSPVASMMLSGGGLEVALPASSPAEKNNGGVDKPRRNDVCSCGSGKKWKKCGELNTEEHQILMVKK